MKQSIYFLSAIFAIILWSCNDNEVIEKTEEATSSFYETEFVFTPDSVNLFGTLLMPDSTGKYPLVIMVAGSGPTDRNGNNPLGVKAKPFQLLADTLVKSGIASFRYDKRAIGKSVAKGMTENNLRFDHYVNDLTFIVKELKKDSRFSKIIIMGHSEGSLIGAISSLETNPDKYISVSGVSRPADSILYEQLSASPDIDKVELSDALEKIKIGEIVTVEDDKLKMIFRESVQPYMTSWFKYSPQEIYAQLTMPVLVIHGTTDIQVPVSDAEALSKANVGSKLSIVDGMNHVLKDAPADTLKNAETYSDASLPLTKKFVEDIIVFVKE